MAGNWSRFAGAAWGVFLAAIYPLLAIAPLVIIAVLHPRSDHLRAAEVGVDCAAVGYTILLLQFVITARFRWIEAPFGLDVLMVFHRAMALVATTLLCVHPFLVPWGEGGWLLTRWHVDWYIWAGRATLALLLVQAAAGLSRRVMRIPYERWRRIHNLVAPVVLALGFAHAVAAGDDLSGGGLLVWAAMTGIALACWLFGRVVRPWLLMRHAFRVIAVEREAPHVWTLSLRTPTNRPFHFAPGQFQFLRLHGAQIPADDHPFTIASSPTEPGRIRLTIKESGDFTSMIGRVRPGDRATVHGPFGRFSHTLHADDQDLVFVAAGVGITPLMSMLRYMRDRRQPRRVLLVYASHSLADVVFADELAAIEACGTPKLKVVHVLANAPPGWTGETGRLDADRLASLCGGVARKSFYICCPPPMMAALVRGLGHSGVSARRIHADVFSI